ncbi:MAG: hypothetical protein ABI761_19180, partial [Saprospiraceae bacterium]
NQAGKPSLKFANEYINTQKDLSTADNLKFLFEAATEADSRIFDLMLKQKDKLTTLYGAEEVQSRIIAAANKTVKKAIDYKTNELLIVAQERVLSTIPAQSNSFNFESNLAYFAGIQDSEGLLKAMKKNNADIEKNIVNMNALASVVESTFPADSKLLGFAEQGLSKAIPSTNQDPSHLFMLARILALNKKTDKADKMIDEAIVQAKSRNMDSMPMEQFKLQLAKG